MPSWLQQVGAVVQHRRQPVALLDLLQSCQHLLVEGVAPQQQVLPLVLQLQVVVVAPHR